MLTLMQARAVAEAELGSPEVVLLDDATIERGWGWVFFYQSRRYVETGDFSAILGGYAPLIVENETGRVLVTGTAHETEFYLQNYEATGDPHRRPGHEVELVALSGTADRIAVAKLVARCCSLGIGDAKRGLDAVAAGAPFRVHAPALSAARQLCADLAELGGMARQLPEPAT